MSWEPTVCIVVPCFNAEHIVDQCIHSLLAQDYPGEKLRIVAVDDGSTDNTFALLNEFAKDARLSVIQHNKNSGLAAARNTGLQSCNSEVVGFIDSDIAVKQNWLRELLSSLDQDEVIGSMGDTRLSPDLQPNQLDKYMYHPKRGARDFGENKAIKFQWFLFNNSIVKRYALDEVGYFDESFEDYGGEDTDLAIRLWTKYKGGLRFNPRAVGNHYHQRNLKQLKFVLNRYGSSNYLTLLKRYPEYQTELHGNWLNSSMGYIIFNPITSWLVSTAYRFVPSLMLIRFIIIDSILAGARVANRSK